MYLKLIHVFIDLEVNLLGHEQVRNDSDARPYNFPDCNWDRSFSTILLRILLLGQCHSRFNKAKLRQLRTRN